MAWRWIHSYIPPKDKSKHEDRCGDCCKVIGRSVSRARARSHLISRFDFFFIPEKCQTKIYNRLFLLRVRLLQRFARGTNNRGSPLRRNDGERIYMIIECSMSDETQCMNMNSTLRWENCEESAHFGTFRDRGSKDLFRVSVCNLLSEKQVDLLMSPVGSNTGSGRRVERVRPRGLVKSTTSRGAAFTPRPIPGLVENWSR